MTKTDKQNDIATKRLPILLFAVMSMGMGQTVVFAIIPMLGRELFAGSDLVFEFAGFALRPTTELLINLLIAAASFTYFLMTPFWGRRSDVWGRRKVIIIGLLGYSAGTVLFNILAQLGLDGVIGGWILLIALIISRVALALVMSASYPASMAYIVDVTSIDNRTKGISKLAAANGIGSMCGPILASLAGISFLAPLYLQGFLTALAAVAVYLWMPATSIARVRGSVPRKLRFFDARYRYYLFVSLVMFTMMGMVQQTLGFYFQDRLGLSGVDAARYFSFAMMASSGAMLAAQLVVVQRLGLSPSTLLKLGLPIAAVGYLLVGQADSFTLLAVAMSAFGFGMGLAGPGTSTMATLQVSADEQGSLAGLLSAAPGLGYVLGPLLGGWLYGLELTYPYHLAGLIMLMLALFNVFYLRQSAEKGHK
ncbi:MAG: MFS transporter [Pseudomonadales bacterium]